MKKRLSILLVILGGLLFFGGYASFLNSTLHLKDQRPYRFQVNDRVWYVTGDCPAVVYRLNGGTTWNDLRYMVEYNERGRVQMRWVKEGSLDPYTNQVPVLVHGYER